MAYCFSYITAEYHEFYVERLWFNEIVAHSVGFHGCRVETIETLRLPFTANAKPLTNFVF